MISVAKGIAAYQTIIAWQTEALTELAEAIDKGIPC
jgi:hypothetical protein